MLQRAHTAATRIELEEGMLFTIRHRWRVSRGSQDLELISSRGTILVENVEASGSAQIRVVFIRPGDDSWIVARLALHPDGRVAHDPTVLCEGHALELERLLRHLVMPAAVQEQLLESELVEEEIAGQVELSRSERRIELRATATRAVRGVEVGDLSVSGRADFRLQARFGSDGLSGRRRMRTRIDGRALDSDTGREAAAIIDVESDAVVERLAAGASEPALHARATACIARVTDAETVRVEGPVFEESSMARAVADVMIPMRACYERQLRTDAALNGRIEMSVTFDVSGNATPRVVSSTFTGTAITSCITAILRDIHVMPPPPSATSHQFPLVFEPEASGRSARFAAIEAVTRAALISCEIEYDVALDVTLAADGRVTEAGIAAGPADSTEEGACLLARVAAARAPATSAYTEDRTQRIRVTRASAVAARDAPPSE